MHLLNKYNQMFTYCILRMSIKLKMADVISSIWQITGQHCLKLSEDSHGLTFETMSSRRTTQLYNREEESARRKDKATK